MGGRPGISIGMTLPGADCGQTWLTARPQNRRHDHLRVLSRARSIPSDQGIQARRIAQISRLLNLACVVGVLLGPWRDTRRPSKHLPHAIHPKSAPIEQWLGGGFPVSDLLRSSATKARRGHNGSVAYFRGSARSRLCSRLFFPRAHIRAKAQAERAGSADAAEVLSALTMGSPLALGVGAAVLQPSQGV
jgi:hypothetical protein